MPALSAMPKNAHADSKRSADKKSLNTGAAPEQEKKVDRNQMQETRTAGQFTGRGRPPLQKK